MKRDCPICLCPDKGILYKQNFNNNTVSAIEDYDVVVCKKCGFIYADNIPSQNEMNNYYSAMSKYEFNHRGGIVSDDYMDYYTKIVDFSMPHLNNDAKILDIGCSTGGLLSIFKSRGYLDLLGIDPSFSCVNTARQLYGIQAKVNNISDFDSSEKFDLVILSAVLEHLVDFTDLIQKVRSLLKERGILFIEVPDALRFDSHISAPFQQFSLEHINYFSKYSIRNLLLKFSLNIIAMKENENKINQVREPDLFVLCAKAGQDNSEIVRDDISREKMEEYINKSNNLDSEIKEIIKNKLGNKHKIIVWGTGTHTQRLIGDGLELSKILFFVDSNRNYIGKKLKGIEIKSPQAIKNEDAPILISTYAYQREIANQIKEALKLKNEIIEIY